MRKLIALALLCLAQSALAAEPGRWRIGTGFDYSRGTYGTGIDTTILAVPIDFRDETGPWVLKLSVPYLRISGASAVIPGIGPADRGNRRGGGAVESNASGIGDSTLSATYAAYYDAASRAGFDLTAKLKLATGDENAGLGTGSDDVSVEVDGYQGMPDFTVYGAFGYTIFGDSPVVDLQNVLYGYAGLSRPLNASDHLGFEVDLRQSGSPAPLARRELMGFFMRRFDLRWRGQAYLLKGFADGSPDWGLGATIAYSF